MPGASARLERLTDDHLSVVITGLVPVISFARSAVLSLMGMAGTSPAMT
jgi:hypothetical protein